MDKIRKFLMSLDKKRLKKIYPVIRDIEALRLHALDVKKLKGYDNLFRVRVGKIRIVFMKGEKEGIVVDINTRENIY